MSIRFEGRVAIVTGGGGGLGRAYALLLASKGAAVIVNDYGGSETGGEPSVNAQRPADTVVNEIREAGGTATANYDSVEFGEKIVKAAVEAYGTVDIVINNAGIIRKHTIQNMTELDWDLTMTVHLKGAFSVTKAAWNIMRKKRYGRIVNTGSSAGIFGSYGVSNYATAKLGLWGFTQALAEEGKKYNIKVNCIAPFAGTRMLVGVLPPKVTAGLKPYYVAPFVAYMCHKSFEESGSLWEVGAGTIARVRQQRTAGVCYDLENPTIESIRDGWSRIGHFEDGPMNPTTAFLEQFPTVVAMDSPRRREAKL